MGKHTETGSTSPTGRPTLELLGTLCGNGTCPTVYRTNRGTLIVQGRTVPSGEAGVDPPDGESLVEIPEELLTAVLAQLSGRPAAPVQD